MSENSSNLPSPSGKHTNPFSALFASPKLFMGFSSKSFIDSEASMSPKSILETKPFAFVRNHNKKPYWGNGDSTPIGLGIVDALSKDKSEKKTFNQSSTTRMVLFGSQLKIQIPDDTPTMSLASPRTFKGCLSPSEMELSEDYTCVISYGPNPKKTHIFDNCVLEKCGDGFVASKRENSLSTEEDFLSFCHACRKRLAQGKDIFMYRGERAFCSHECRQQEMISDAEETESCFEDLLDLF